MSGLAELGNLWHTIQTWLLPMLEDELGELDEKHREFVAVCETCVPYKHLAALATSPSSTTTHAVAKRRSSRPPKPFAIAGVAVPSGSIPTCTIATADVTSGCVAQ